MFLIESCYQMPYQGIDKLKTYIQISSKSILVSLSHENVEFFLFLIVLFYQVMLIEDGSAPRQRFLIIFNTFALK